MNSWHAMSVGVFALAILQAAASAAVPPDVAQDLAKKSGSWLQLESLGAQVRAGMASAIDRDGEPHPDATKARLLACADTAFGAEAMRATAVEAMAGALQPDDVAALLAWYDSALGRKIADMEVASAAQVSDPAERLRRGDQALRTASAGRQASLQSIIAETRSVDVMADGAIAMAIAVRQGLAGIDPATSAGAMAGIKADLSAKRPQLVERYAHMALPAYAFAYAGLGDDELSHYAEHLASPAAKAYGDGAVRGVARALTDGSVKLGRCLREAAPAKAP